MTPRSLPGGMDYLLRPVRAGMLRYQDLDGYEITMADLFLINSYLDNENWNKAEANRRIMTASK